MLTNHFGLLLPRHVFVSASCTFTSPLYPTDVRKWCNHRCTVAAEALIFRAHPVADKGNVPWIPVISLTSILVGLVFNFKPRKSKRT